MTAVTEIIINSILTACGGAIFAGICVWVKGLYRKSKNYDKAVKALAHDAFFRYWTLKEAFIKALGEGLSHPLHQFDVTIESPIALITRPDASEAANWSLQRVDAGPDHAAAFALRR
jgi:hypothetical protein